jgi:hypothetical protein
VRRLPHHTRAEHKQSSGWEATPTGVRGAVRVQSRVSGALVAVLFVVSIGVASIPVFDNRFLSINDYYNHLARTAILLHYTDEPTFSVYFLPNWQLLPNLAFDIWVCTLGRILPIVLAGKLFIVAIFAFTLGGVIFLHRLTFGGWSLWPFLAVLLLYNRLLLVGYLNFLFGVGLWLHALSLWVRFRDARAWLRVAVLAPAAIIIFLAHLAAFGVLAVTIAVYELAAVATSSHRWPTKFADLFLAGIAFAPPILLAVFLSPHSEASAAMRYRDLTTRVAGFAAPILYDWRIDAVCFLVLLGLFAWAVVTRSICFDPRLTACASVLFALQFAMPNVIMTAEGGDRRLPLPMMLLAIGATDLRAGLGRLPWCLILATGGAFALRIAGVEARWQADQPIYDDISRGMSLLPAGARVASSFPPDSFNDFSVPALAISYLPVWEIVSHGGFTQTLFAYPTQQPLVFTPKYEALAAATPPGLLWQIFVAGNDTEKPAVPLPALVAALHEYQFIAFFGRNNFAVRNTPLFQKFYAGQYVRIYQLKRQ